LKLDVDKIPAELKESPQWVAWRAVEKPGTDKFDKIPINPVNGQPASSTNSETWGTFQQALSAYQTSSADGVGFVFSEDDSYAGVDLDGCRDPQTGEIEPLVWEIINAIQSYTEVSPSGKGVKIFCKGKLPPGKHKDDARGIEMYDHARFFTVTGAHLEGTPFVVEDRQEEFVALHSKFFDGSKARDTASERNESARTAAKLFAAHWHHPKRHNLCLAFGGWAVRAGVPLVLAKGAIEEIVALADDEMRGDYLRSVEDSYATYNNGEQVWGGPKLEEITKDDRFTKKLRQALFSINGGPPEEEHEERKSYATKLVEQTLSARAEFWHSPEKEAYATVEVEGHKENWLLKSKGFRLWLSRLFYLEHKKSPPTQAMQDALNVLGGKALFDGPKHKVFTRVAEEDGTFYLDLANDHWEVVEITEAGWQVIVDPPVKFCRARGLLPLPRPVERGSVEELRRFVNVGDEGTWVLLLAWLLMSLNPRGPYPILVLHGEQGSAKSTTAKILKAIVDPSEAPLKSEPRDGRDLMIAAENGWVLSYDNLSYLPRWLSDSFCRLATGGGFSTRELYTDRDEVIFNTQRPVIFNGIEELATRGDLLDRAIIEYLPAILEERRRPEGDFWHEFEEARPRILGALLNAVSVAKSRGSSVRLSRLPRMADFATWVTAAEPALGWQPETFMVAYTGNREAANELALEASPVAAAIRNLVEEQGKWEGIARELLEKLTDSESEKTTKAKSWPKTPRALSNVLRRLAPNLRAVGISLNFWREPDRERRRMITIKKEVGNLRPHRPQSPDVAHSGRVASEAEEFASEENGLASEKPQKTDATDATDAKIPTYSHDTRMSPEDLEAARVETEERAGIREDGPTSEGETKWGEM